jgi:hypothetical protein
MEIQADFRDLLALLNKHRVDYVVVGGYALAYLGAPRYTGDLDILIRPDPANGRRVLTALEEFGFGAIGLTRSDFEKPGQVIQLGHPPVRVDLVTSLTGVSWTDAAKGRQPGKYGDIPVHFLGKKEFLSNKRAMARKKDLADLEALGEQ